MAELKPDIGQKLAAFEARKDHTTYTRKKDVYVNAFSGFGGTRDPLQRTGFQAGQVMAATDLETLYRYNWLARRIVESIPEDAVRQWIQIQMEDADLSSDILQRLDDLDAPDKFEEALSLARLYGGSLMILGALDGNDPIEPLDETKIEKIRFLNNLDRWQIAIGRTYDDPLEPKFGMPKTYRLQPVSGKSLLSQSEIHESRVIRFDGAYLPERTRTQNQGWCDPIFVGVNESLKNHGVSIQAGAVLFQDFITKVLKIPNLAQLIADGNEATLLARIQYAISNMSSQGVSLIGSDEEMDKIQTPITGLVEMIEKYMDIVAAAAGIPKTRLFGQQLGTLSGADETTRNYYDLIKSYQIKQLKKPIHRLISLILAEHKKSDTTWSFTFAPLWQPTEKETAETRKIVAETDQIYVTNNVLLPDEVAVNRFGSDGYSMETVIDMEKRDDPADRGNKPEEEEA